MFTIIKKELRSYFRRGSGYFFIAISMLFVGILTIGYNFYYGSTKLETILPGASMILSLLLPIFAMNIFAREKNARTDKLLFALPFKTHEIVFGKYLSMLSFVGIETVVLALLPIILGFFGEVNYLSAYLSLICFFLFGAMLLALCTFIAALVKSALTSVILSYLAVFVAFILYLVPTGANRGLWQTTAKTLRFLSPFSHLDEFLRGAFKINSIIYFILFTVLFLFLAILATKRSRETMKYGKKSAELKKLALSPLLAVILCICTVAVSASTSFAPLRYSSIDMTDNRALSISDTTKDFISSLELDIRIYVINPDSSDEPFEDLVSLYDEYSDRVSVIFVEADEIGEKLISLGWDGVSEIAPYTLVIESDKGDERVQIINPSTIYYYEHPEFGQMDQSTYSYYYSMLSQYASSDETYAEMLSSFLYDTKIYYDVEHMINAAIDYNTVEIIPKPYYVTGHGEPSAETSTLHSAFTSIGLTFGTFDLTSEAIPEDACSLIINAPTSDISENEKAIIESFLKNGGAMTVITNEANLSMQNLMSLITSYGVSANAGYVSYDYVAELEEQNKYESVDDPEEPDDTPTVDELPDTNLVSAYFNESHDATAPLTGYTTNILRANHIEVSDELGASVIVTPLLTTDEKCFIEGVENSAGTKTVAVAIEEETENGTTQIVWFTGADAFDGDGLQTMNVYASAYAILWGTDNYESDLEVVEPKPLNTSYVEVSATTRLVLLVVFIAVIPASLAIVGIVAHKKYKKDPFAKKNSKELEDTQE